MPATEQITITLPNELSAKVRDSISSGDFADASDLVEQSLKSFVLKNGQPFGMSDTEFDTWLRQEVVPVYDAMKADPSRALTADQVRDRLARRHAEFLKAT